MFVLNGDSNGFKYAITVTEIKFKTSKQII